MCAQIYIFENTSQQRNILGQTTGWCVCGRELFGKYIYFNLILDTQSHISVNLQDLETKEKVFYLLKQKNS